jgi:DNA-binding transcriptional ArsR family regulator
LKTAGLARSERDGKMVMYELTETGRQLVAAVTGERVRAWTRPSCRSPRFWRWR